MLRLSAVSDDEIPELLRQILVVSVEAQHLSEHLADVGLLTHHGFRDSPVDLLHIGKTLAMGELSKLHAELPERLGFPRFVERPRRGSGKASPCAGDDATLTGRVFQD